MWDAAVDYIRLTHRRAGNDEWVANQYASAVERAGAYASKPGAPDEPWSWQGYRGYRVGAVAWGQSHQGYILQASGLAAREVSLLRLPYTNVPRIDIQATFWYQADTPGLARDVAQMAVEGRRGKRGRPTSVRTIDGHGEGDTCYVGTRGKKSRYLRCYDKWRESKREEAYRYSWRFEAELTDEYARDAFGTHQDLGRGAHASYGQVLGFFGQRGIVLPELDGVRAIEPSSLPKDEGSTERFLRWLETQVRPALEKGIARGADLDAVVVALGLTRNDVLKAYLHH